MQRRTVIAGLAAIGAGLFFTKPMSSVASMNKLNKSEAEWLKIIKKNQYNVLFKEATERPFSSPLNDEKRKGTYVCAAKSVCNRFWYSMRLCWHHKTWANKCHWRN